MAKVAANQDRSEQARKQYVYRQHIHVVTRKTNGKLMREETTDYQMVPQADKTHRQLEKLTGKYWDKHKYIEFSGEPCPRHGQPRCRPGQGHARRPDRTEVERRIRAEPVSVFDEEAARLHASSWLVVRRSKDTMPTASALRRPTRAEYDWAGEAYIDAADFEPIYVYTKLSRKLPFAVQNACWAPTFRASDTACVTKSSRAECGFRRLTAPSLRLHVLFFLNREMMVSLDNKDFQQTHVETKITADATARNTSAPTLPSAGRSSSITL